MHFKDLRHAVILGSFCLGFGLVMAATKSLASADIENRAMEDRLSSLEQVLPGEFHDNNPLTDTVLLKDAEGKDVTVYKASKSGKLTGFAYEVQRSGYAGPIRLMMGIDANGQIIGVRVLAHKETPGLGDRIEAKKSPWILQFSGLSDSNPAPERWKVKKDGGQFDQFAGATITPRAVVKAVHGGLEFFAANKSKLLGGS
jgi:electron transport complex protein RnfG